MMSILLFKSVISKVLDRIVPDKNARAAADEQLEAAEQSGELQLMLGQLEINKVEAAHKSLFVAGARPAALWVCCFALAYNTILYPTLDIWLVMPAIQGELLYPILTGLLGLSGIRGFEKSRGVAREK